VKFTTIQWTLKFFPRTKLPGREVYHYSMDTVVFFPGTKLPGREVYHYSMDTEVYFRGQNCRGVKFTAIQ
jgi:hypothetical protein